MLYAGMRELAETGRWRLEPADPGLGQLYSTVSLNGADGDVPVCLERIGGAQTFITRASLHPPLAFHFAITHEGLAGMLKNFIGFKDVEVGDVDFDKVFRVVSKDVDAVRALLNPDVRTHLQQLYAHTKPLGMRGFHVSERGLAITRVTGLGAGGMGTMTKDELLADVPIAAEVVRALRRASFGG